MKLLLDLLWFLFATPLWFGHGLRQRQGPLASPDRSSCPCGPDGQGQLEDILSG